MGQVKMKLEYVPLLQVQRDLYQMPRGFARFREYLQTMVDPESGDLTLPLSGMNPMAKEHVAELLDRLLAIDADGEAARALEEATATLADAPPGEYKVTTVINDDAQGGWTNRFTTDFGYRFRGRAYHRRGWCAVTLWSSEEYTAEQVRAEVKLCVYRLAHIVRRGYAQTLGELLAQEQYAMQMAGVDEPQLAPEALARTRALLTPLLDSDNYAVQIAALYGDPAAHALGYTPLGLPANAGLALAREGVT
jgi:hypothetical protein